jgi:hypothetical protein
VVTKAGHAVPKNAAVRINAEEPKYVCRAGFKLKKALDHFHIDVTGATALDSGLSTGGFTHCLLQRGARHVSWDGRAGDALRAGGDGALATCAGYAEGSSSCAWQVASAELLDIHGLQILWGQQQQQQQHAQQLLELNCSRSAAPVIVLPFDCCMVRVQVYGVDVGHGQVMGSIAQDPRVTVMERINLRHLKPEQLPEQVSTFWQGQCSSLAACTAAQTSQDGLCAGRRHPCKCAGRRHPCK